MKIFLTAINAKYIHSNLAVYSLTAYALSLIHICKLTPGMALGQDIYDGAGRLLLAKHLLLSEEYISNLEFLGFPGIYIDDEFTQGIEIQQVLNPQVRSQALKVVHEMCIRDRDVYECVDCKFINIQ